jgi:hypothetical protein
MEFSGDTVGAYGNSESTILRFREYVLTSDDGDDEGCMLGKGTRAGRDGFISDLLFLVDEDMFVCPREVDFSLSHEPRSR